MSNSLLTINMITREAIRLFKNSNNFIKSIDTQYDDQFARTGAKIGTALRIRLPNDFTVRTGAAAQVQDTTEQSTTLTLATQKGVDVSFNSVDRTMSLDDFSTRILAPMINNLAGAVAYDIMTGVEGGISNYTANTDSGGNIITPTAETWLNAGAILDQNSAHRGNRKIVMDPLTQARTVASLSGLFNPQPAVSKQYQTGEMYQALGYEWMMDQTVIKHTTATYSAFTVSGAGQTGLTLTTSAITGGLNAGDIISVPACNSVNRVTKQSNGVPQQFVVTSAVATGGTSVPIYPAIIPPSGSNVVQYQTVDSSPANGATVTVVSKASEVYRKNFAFIPEAVTMATADLQLPEKGIVEGARDQYDGISMRMISDYVVSTDQWITRLDVLYGYKWVRPEWAVVIADAV